MDFGFIICIGGIVISVGGIILTGKTLICIIRDSINLFKE